MKKREKKLSLNRETIVKLQAVKGGLVRNVDAVASDGPMICYFSDCNPCEGGVYAN